jgi:hypothetical protein
MKKVIFYSLILTLLASGARFSFAAISGSYTLLEPLPCIQNTGNNCKTGESIPAITINQYIGYVFKFALALAVFLAVVMIIWGGFEYMLSEVVSSKADAKSKITNAIYGLVMTLASYLILQTIDPRLVQINTTIEPVEITPDSTLEFDNRLQQSVLTLTNPTTIQRVSDLGVKIADLNQQKIDLKTKCKAGEIDEGECARTDYDLTQKINAASSELIQVNANSKMGVRFLGAISEIEDGRATADSTKFLVDGINTSWAQSLARPEINSDPQARAALLFQKDFRIDQIKEEQKLNNDLEGYKGASKSKGQSLRLPLEATLVKYNDELTFLSTADDRVSSTIKDDKKLYDDLIKLKKEDSVLSREYQKVLQSRVTEINSYLPPQTKK